MTLHCCDVVSVKQQSCTW